MFKLLIHFSYFQLPKKIQLASLLVLGFILNQTSKAQNSINFTDSLTGKVIHAKTGDYLILKYKGYLGQTEYFKHTLQEVGDSSILVGIVHPYAVFSPVFAGMNNPWKEIKLKDIESFKRRSAGANFLKSMIGIGAGLSAVLMLKSLNEEKKFSNGKNLAISLGVGLGINIGMNMLFSDKPKNHIKDGWRIESVK